MARRARLLAPFALAALERGRRAVARRASSTPAASSLPVLGAALLPHALGALGAAAQLVGVDRRRCSPLVGARGLRACSRSSRRPPRSGSRAATRGTRSTASSPAGGTCCAPRRRRRRPPTARILLAVLAVWCMAAIADWLAFATPSDARRDLARARVLRVDVDARHRATGSVLLTVGFCVAAGAFLLAQNLAVLDRRRSWLVSQQARARRTGWPRPRCSGCVAMLVALVRRARRSRAPASDPLLDVANTGRDDTGGPQLPALAGAVRRHRRQARRRRTTTSCSRCRSSQPDYWRIAALDQYTGDERRPVDAERARATAACRSACRATSRARCEQEFAIGPLGERWLPAAYRPVAISLPDTLVVRVVGHHRHRRRRR